MAAISENDNGIKLACVGENISKNGDLMNLQFKIKSDVKDSIIPLEVEVQKMINDLGEQNIVDVENVTQNGSIMVISDNEIKTNDEKIEVKKNENGSYKLENKVDSKKVTYSTSDETVATVDKNGSVIAKKAGEVKITANYEDGTKEEVTINVPESVSELSKNVINKDNDENIDEGAVNQVSEVSNNKISKKKIVIIISIVAISLIILFLKIKRKKK